MHIERIYIPDALYDEFRDKFVAATEALEIGATYDFEPELGSLVSVDHRDRVRLARRGRGRQGRDRADRRPRAARPRPGVLRADDPRGRHQGHARRLDRDVRPGGRAVPLLATVDEAIALANDTDYGLNASVWGERPRRAREAVARRIESGNVNINDSLATAYASKGTPSGGVKQSGVGARHGDQGLLKYTDVPERRGAQEAGHGRRSPGQDYDAYAKQTRMSLKIDAAGSAARQPAATASRAPSRTRR